MFDWLDWMFDEGPFTRRPDCGGWDETLIWLTVTSDILIWLAYMAIPFMLWQVIRVRKVDPRKPLVWLFIAFIFSCGFTHFFDMLAFYHPMYRANGAMLAVTALVSWTTVLALTPALPRLMTLRTPEDLQAEIDRREKVELELRETQADLERRVAERTRELEVSNTDLEEFAYVASHDLQEPLRKINSFSELLGEELGTNLTVAGRDYLLRMQNAAQRMNTMIHDLLRVSRSAASGEQLKRVSLDEILTGALQDVDASIKDAGAHVEAQPLGEATVAPVGMTQVFINLLGNAVKYRRRDVPLKVRIASHRTEDGMLEVTIADNGIGFEQQYAERIFKPFQRLHSREEYPGTGIGLAVCRKIIERQGGRISAHGTPGEGATFRFTVPTGEKVK